MANPVPLPTYADSTGLPDAQWIADARDGLNDYPQYAPFTWTADGTNGALAAGAAPLKVPNPPINDGSLLVFNSTTATSYTPITSGTPTASQVLVNYDTGELTWLNAPTTGNVIQINFQTCRWRDGSIERVLYDGLHAMFPSVGRMYVDTSIAIQVNIWDYALPAWAQTPGARISRLEIADPFIPTEPFRPFRGAIQRVGYNVLHIPTSQRFSPVARLRLTGWGPFMQLGDLPQELYELPLLYAWGRLLPKKDMYRLREDTMVPLTQEGGQQPGLLTSSGQGFMQEFRAQLEALSRKYGPPDTGLRQVSTYARDRYF